jgi:hypothetical protein
MTLASIRTNSNCIRIARSLSTSMAKLRNDMQQMRNYIQTEKTFCLRFWICTMFVSRRKTIGCRRTLAMLSHVTKSDACQCQVLPAVNKDVIITYLSARENNNKLHSFSQRLQQHQLHEYHIQNEFKQSRSGTTNAIHRGLF